MRAKRIAFHSAFVVATLIFDLLFLPGVNAIAASWEEVLRKAKQEGPVVVLGPPGGPGPRIDN